MGVYHRISPPPYSHPTTPIILQLSSGKDDFVPKQALCQKPVFLSHGYLIPYVPTYTPWERTVKDALIEGDIGQTQAHSLSRTKEDSITVLYKSSPQKT
jgi:hypothetical protein